MAVNKPIGTQIENRNFLAPTGFLFQVNKAPKVSYFGKKVNIPALNFDTANFPNYLSNIPLPGTQITFADLTLEFLVDENLENYIEIQNWMRGIGFPESLSETYNWQLRNGEAAEQQNALSQPERSQLNLYSDCTLTVLDSMNNAKFKCIFQNAFPVSLTTLEFDATQTDLTYFTAQVTFKYMIYNIDEIASCC